MKYFEMDFDRDKLLKTIGLAYQLDESGEPFVLPDSGYVSKWTPPQLIILEGIDGGFADYQPNDMAARMCSRRLRDLLEEHASESDLLQWLSVSIKGTRHRKPKPYYILHFAKPADVLDRAETRYVPGDDYPVVPVLDRNSAEGRHVFCFAGAGRLSLVVSENVKRTIQSRKFTGMTFTPVRASQNRGRTTTRKPRRR